MLSQAVFTLLYLKCTKRKMHFDQSNPYQKLENKPSTESIEKGNWGIKTTKNNYCKAAGKREKRWLTLKDGSYLFWWAVNMAKWPGWSRICLASGLGLVTLPLLLWDAPQCMTTVLKKALLFKREDFKQHVKRNHVFQLRFHLQSCWGHTSNRLTQEPEVPWQQEAVTLPCPTTAAILYSPEKADTSLSLALERRSLADTSIKAMGDLLTMQCLLQRVFGK